jgi:hypothetical protein
MHRMLALVAASTELDLVARPPPRILVLEALHRIKQAAGYLSVVVKLPGPLCSFFSFFCYVFIVTDLV